MVMSVAMKERRKERRNWGWLVALLVIGTVLLSIGIIVAVYIRKTGLAVEYEFLR